MIDKLGSLNTVAITLFIGFFIVYSIILLLKIVSKSDLRTFGAKLISGTIWMYLLFAISLTTIYSNLAQDGYVFKAEYKAKIDINASSVKIGTGASKGIQLYNQFSDKSHAVFHFDKNNIKNGNTTVKVLSMKRSAIVNGKYITAKEKELKITQVIKSGDILKINAKEYKVIFENTSKNFSLHRVKESYGFPKFKKFVFRTFDKIYTLNQNTGNEIVIGPDKKADIFLDGNSTISIYFQKGNSKNKVFVTLLKGDDVYVNGIRLSFDPKIYPSKMSIKKGDIIRLGYSDYKIDFNNQELILHNIFFTPSIVNLFNIYSTTTIPNIAQNIPKAGTISLWWIYALTLLVTFMVMMALLFLIRILTAGFSLMGDKRLVMYPFLYFTFFLSFLLFASMINFTILQYQQVSIYNKGALYTVLFVYMLLLFTFFIAWLGYSKSLVVKILGLIIVVGVVYTPWMYESYIYTSKYLFGLNKTLLMTSLDLFYVFSVFGLLLGHYIRTLQENEHSIFFRREKRVNINFFKKLLLFSLLAVSVSFVVSVFMTEGAGIVVVETVKLLLMFLLVVVFLDDFLGSKKAFYSYLFVIIAVLVFAVGVFLKDTGSLLQIVIALSMSMIFFFDRLRNIGFFNKTVKGIGIGIVLGIVAGSYMFVGKTDNVRIPMWIEPFAQTLETNSKFFMYYFDQVAKELYLMQEATFFPRDFTTDVFTVLPNLHTDFIFAFSVNVFGILGFIAIVLGFFITVFSFKDSISVFQNSRSDIYRFIYGVNVVFVVYFFSYIIINILAVLQVIPLTDVPFPILTYGRGVTILFFVWFVFIAIINYFYLDFASRKIKSRV